MYIKIRRCACFNSTILGLVMIQTAFVAVIAVQTPVVGFSLSPLLHSEESTRYAFAELFNTYRAEKFGLLQPPVTLTSNRGIGVKRGKLTAAFLESRGIEGAEIVDLNGTLPSAPDHLMLLKKVLAGEAGGDALSLLFDEQKLIAWYALAILSGSDGEVTFFYDPKAAQFQPVVHITTLATLDSIFTPAHPLLRAIERDADLRPRAEQYLWSYVNDISEMRDDSVKANAIAAEIETPFMATTLDRIRSIHARKGLELIASAAKENMMVVHQYLALAQIDMRFQEVKEDDSLLQLALSDRTAFIKRYPFFNRYGVDGVSLDNWYRIREDVVIPKSVRLVLEKGTRLRFDPGVSILSYAPVEMKGTKREPIVLESATDEPWGTFAVLNAEGQSEVQWVKVSGGRSDTINGATIPAMFAFHGSPVIIADSQLINATGKAALSLSDVYVDLKRVHFADNAGNGVLIDDATAGSIEHSVFMNHGGSAIVLTSSPIIISDAEIDGSDGSCIEIARQSTPQIRESALRNCAVGISVAGDSHPMVENVVFEGNAIAMEATVEHNSDFPPSLTVTGSEFIENGEQVRAEEGAVVTVE